MLLAREEKKRSDLESSALANKHAIEWDMRGELAPFIFNSRAEVLGTYPVRRTISQSRS